MSSGTQQRTEGQLAVRVTVAMPTYQRRAYALEALDSILAQETQTPFEILVLDNALDAGLRQAVEKRQRKTDLPVSYIEVAEIGLHNGRHTAVARARGGILAFIDDDIVADRQWLASIVEVFGDETVHLATGPCLPAYEIERPDWIDAFWRRIAPGKQWCGYLGLLDLGPERQDIDPLLVFGANFAIRKETLIELGGFHPDGLPWELRRYRGDGETAISLEAKKRGLRARYHPAARVRHRVPAQRLTVQYFERRAFLQGISDSFTEFRRGDNPSTSSVVGANAAISRFLSRLRRLGNGLRNITWRAAKRSRRVDLVKQRIDAAYRDGYTYHRGTLEIDPDLKAWVRRQDYWHAAVPVGQAVSTPSDAAAFCASQHGRNEG